MPGFIVSPSQEPLLACLEYGPHREPCVPVAEQGNDLIDCPTCHREHVPHTPPSSPNDTPLSCTEPYEACPSTSCALLLVDRKIKAYQAKVLPTEHRNPLGSHAPAFRNGSISRVKLACSNQPMDRMNPLHQVSSASGDDDMTLIDSRCPSSRSSGGVTLVNDLPSDDRQVKAHSTATNNYKQQKIAMSPQSATQNSSPKLPAFKFFRLRASRNAVADAPSRLRAPSKSDDASLPRLSVTGRQISSPTPIGSSAVPDIAALPRGYKQSKTKSWPGPCSQLPGPEILSMPKASARSKSHKCDFTRTICREGKARYDDGMPNCENCLSNSDTYSFNNFSSCLQPLKEHARGEVAMDGQQAATTEEECSHFSDYSTDEDDDDEKLPPTIRLPSSLGRLSQRSKTRLSLSGLFSRS